MSIADKLGTAVVVEDVACNLCGSRDARVLYASTLGFNHDQPDTTHFRCTTATYGVHPTIVKCTHCGLVYANPRLDSNSIDDSYSRVDDPLYIEEREGRVLTFRRNLRPLEQLVSTAAPRRLLDVGCHIGVMLEIAQERSWQAAGIEPSTWAAARARERGLNVINSTLANAHLPSGTFDAVTLWDVVEHLTNPAADLQEVHRLLKPAGVVGIHTIDIESPLARLMGPRWPWLMEMHLYYFSPLTLGRMLGQIGFKVESVIYQGRYLRLGYLLTRIEPYNKGLAKALDWVADHLRLCGTALPINFGDLFTVFARKS
jgi:2-polyprenyl-3-methyl-5-hydroxy-6-metoxy-1,4-benzoquinol methylase